MKVITSEQGRLELERLDFDIIEAISKILDYVPEGDILGLSYIFVVDLPSNRKSFQDRTLGSYFPKVSNQPAYIELYLKNLFAHIKSAESLRQMLPIQELGLATTIYHEIGHHVRQIRTHGISKSKNENFARSYGKEIMNTYILNNAKSIKRCFADLENSAESKGLSLEVITKMKTGGESYYKEAKQSESSLDTSKKTKKSTKK